MHTSIDHPLRWRPRRLRALRPAKRGLLTLATFGVLVMLLAPSAHAQLPMRGLTTSPLTTGPSPAVEDLSRIVTAEAAWIPAERLMVGRNTGYSVRLMAVQIEIQNPFHINPARTQIPPSLSFLIPTEVTITQAPAGWRARATVYPQPSVVQVAYTGQPAPVPVFHGKIVLLVPFVVDADAATGPVSVDLRYQACDDLLCYQARRLPLEWRIPAAAFRSSRAGAR